MEWLSKAGGFFGVFSSGKKDREEFNADPNPECPKTMWDYFIDGLNRTIRPLLLFGIIAMFWWAVVAPLDFVVWSKALKELPEQMWYLAGLIVSGWMGVKAMGDWHKAKKISSTVINNGGVVVDGGGSEEEEEDFLTFYGRFKNLHADDQTVFELATDNPSIEEWQKSSAA